MLAESGELDRRLPPITAINQMDRGQCLSPKFPPIIVSNVVSGRHQLVKYLFVVGSQVGSTVVEDTVIVHASGTHHLLSRTVRQVQSNGEKLC